MVSVDCLDLEIQEPWPYNFRLSRMWYSHKFKGPGLRYEVAVSILGGDIVWTCGPFPCGRMNDLMIFREGGLKDALERGERVEADDGYAALDPQFVRSKSGAFHPEETKIIRNRIMARQETANKRLTQWNVLAQIFRHDLSKHSICFRAVANITQLAIEDGDTLFEVEGIEDYY